MVVPPREPAAPVSDSWERYRVIADNSGDVVYQTSLDGRILWIQPTVTALLGYDPDDLVGVEARSLVHRDDLAMVSRERLRVYAGTELDEIHCRFRTVDGGYRSCTVRARPLRTPDGEVVGAVMTLRDVSDRIAALRALATLSRASTTLVRSRDEQTLLDDTCRIVCEAGDYPLVWYGRLTDDEERRLEPAATSGTRTRFLKEAGAGSRGGVAVGGPSGLALARDEMVVVADLAADPKFDAWRDLLQRTGVRSVIALPVHTNNKLDGVLVVYGDEPNDFDKDAQDLLADLASGLGYGIGRLRDAADRELTHVAAEEHSSRLHATLDSLFDPLAILETVRDDQGRAVDLRYRLANDAAVAYHGVTRETLLSQTMLEAYPNLMAEGPLQDYLDCAETGQPVVLDDYPFENHIIGEERRYDLRAVKSGDGIVLTWRDVTDRWREARRVAEDERRYRLVAEHGSDVMWEIDPDGRITWVSGSVTRLLGWERDEILGRSSMELFHPDDVETARSNRARVLSGESATGEFRLAMADGGYRWMSLTAQPVAAEQGVGGMAALRDIDDEVRGRAELEHAVLHDAITGAPTRSSLMARLHAALDDPGTGLVALLCADVDGLSAVNEGMSYSAGDIVLAQLADRVANVVGDWDLIARGSGDELLVLLTGLANAETAELVADDLRAAVRRPIELSGRELHLSVSIGIATSGPGVDAESMLRDAGLAVLSAQAAGGDSAAFVDPVLAEHAARRLHLDHEIRRGLAAGEFQAWLQPIVSLRDSSLRGYEALVRWVRPDGTVVPPMDFLPQAERSGLVVDLDHYVLDRAISSISALAPGSTVAVNLATASLSRAGLAEVVLDALERHGVPAERLHLEVTETALLENVVVVREQMIRLADAGVSWYVDDFGTGYSSISHLRDLPIAGLKLDRSFTVGVSEGDVRCANLSQALVGLAVGLGLDSVAEGVETAEVAETLAAHGWRHGQGWLYGRAEPPPAR